MTKHPENMPAEPNPATALPMMSMFEDVAVPQNKEPTMEMTLAIRNRYLTENNVYALPNMN
jgi:hypothetical protein